MRKFLFIARDDAHQINSSVLAKIFITLLISIPLLFTWFNVLATWNPFANNDQLKIAIANTDKSYTSDVLNMNINVGDMVLKELATNDKLNWVITGKEAALEGTRSGEYYAAIILPADFSKSMFTFYLGGASPANVMLYTNEKKNPLSANLTSQIAQGAIAQINNVFSRTLAEVAVGFAKEVSGHLDDANTQAALDRFSNRLEAVSSQLTSGADTMSSLSALIGSSIPLATGASNLAASVGNSFDAVKGSLSSAGGTSTDPFTAAESSLSDSLSQASSSIDTVNARLNDVLTSAEKMARSNADILDNIVTGMNAQIAGFQETRDKIENALGQGPHTPAVEAFLDDLDSAIAKQQSLADRLHSLASALREGAASNDDSRAAAQAAIQQAHDAINNARHNFDANLRPQISALRTHLAQANKNAAVVGSYMDSIRAALAQNSGSMIATLRSSQASLADTAQSMRDGAQRLNKALAQLNKARGSGDLTAVAKALGSDPDALASLISAPINVERDAVFPVAAFGVGMTPLFAVIALWVGALLTGAFLRTDVSPNVAQRFIEAHPESATGNNESTANDTALSNEATADLRDNRNTASDGAAETARSATDSESADRAIVSQIADGAHLVNDTSSGSISGHTASSGDSGERHSAPNGNTVENNGASDGDAAETLSGASGHARAEETATHTDTDTHGTENREQVTASNSGRVFTGVQEYLGRYIMFWLVGMAQSTFLIGGLIVFVDIQPAHPFLLILAGWLISTVFTLCIYTLVVALANAGKAVGVVLLVLQISAAGGAYPLELLPQWFQNISPWLPATYAINMMRSAIAGEYAGDYLYNALMLVLFVVPNLVIALVLRRAVARIVNSMTVAIEQTKVM
ncbi:MAG: YhgE/Pip domain-containing protein [Arcanobacterium sp.]|nr:YhgE/Pip domain-containing protein [Arcanobacterium sp.]MDY5588702.1 YhgE/Pip domain-containing protein [Arcanobacterium sp.]